MNTTMFHPPISVSLLLMTSELGGEKTLIYDPQKSENSQKEINEGIEI